MGNALLRTGLSLVVLGMIALAGWLLWQHELLAGVLAYCLAVVIGMILSVTAGKERPE